MADVRSKLGAPIASDFDSHTGTPIVVNQTTGDISVLKIDNTIFSYKGIGTLTAADVINVPAGNIAATNIQTALNELDTEKALLGGSSSQAFSASTITAQGGRSTFAAVSEHVAIGAKYVSTGGSVYFGATDATSTPGGQISNAVGSSMISWTYGGAITVGELTASGNTKIKATRGTVQNIANVTDTILIFNTEVYDTLAEYDPATGRATISKAGYYHVHGQAISASAAWAVGAEWNVKIFINGAVATIGTRTQMAAAATVNLGTQVDADLLLAAGDIVDIRIYHNQGAAIDVFAGAFYNQFSIHRIP